MCDLSKSFLISGPHRIWRSWTQCMVFRLCSSDPQDSPWAGYLGEQKGSWNDKGSITSHPPFISTRETSLLTVLRIRVLSKSSLIKGFHCKQNILKPFSSIVSVCSAMVRQHLNSLPLWTSRFERDIYKMEYI